MGKYTKKKLKTLTTDGLMVLYSLNLLYPKPASSDEILATIAGCNLQSMSRDKLISLLIAD